MKKRTSAYRLDRNRAGPDRLILWIGIRTGEILVDQLDRLAEYSGMYQRKNPGGGNTGAAQKGC